MNGNEIKNKALSMSEDYPASERTVYRQGFIEGSYWMIDKACKWLGNVSWIDDFKKAMEDTK